LPIEQELSKDELSSRFFEGAASGTIMLGEPPETTDFQANFGWEDAVIRVPFDCSDIASVITKLDKQPERLKHIRENNVVNSLRRHDSVYRLKEILNKSGLEATPKMLAREDTLNKLAQSYLDHEYIHVCN
jgi:spore maturation protein CgeB